MLQMSAVKLHIFFKAAQTSNLSTGTFPACDHAIRPIKWEDLEFVLQIWYEPDLLLCICGRNTHRFGHIDTIQVELNQEYIKSS